MKDRQGTPEMGMPRHLDWKCIHPKVILASVENVAQSHDSSHPCVAAYVHHRLWAMKPKLRTDIFNHKDIMLITLNGLNSKINLVNAYSDSSGSAIRILRNSNIPLSATWAATSIVHLSTGIRMSFVPILLPTHCLSSRRNMA